MTEGNLKNAAMKKIGRTVGNLELRQNDSIMQTTLQLRSPKNRVKKRRSKREELSSNMEKNARFSENKK